MITKDKIKIAVLTGKRGGFGAMKPMLKIIENLPNTDLLLILTDQHLNPKFGNTKKEIEAEFSISGTVDIKQISGKPVHRAKALGVCVSGMAEILDQLSPDILLLYGDRGEVLAAALAASHLRIPIGHMQGGDVTGNIDDNIRHAVTKMSHLHFASCQQSAQRLISMGEDPKRVHIVGDHHLDPFITNDITHTNELEKKYNVDPSQPFILSIFHPETIRKRDHGRDFLSLANTIVKSKIRCIFIYPCSDHGYDEIIENMQSLKNIPQITIHKNIIAPDFAGLLSIASAIVGNSSSGLVEAPFFGLPSLNIGQRQNGRMRSQNVVDCEICEEEITKGLKKVLSEPFRKVSQSCEQLYGDGSAGEKTVEIILNTNLNREILLDKAQFL